jgi:hypothetical protein
MRIRPRTVPGGVIKDDGTLMVTLYRKDSGYVDFRSYYEMLYPETTHPPPLTHSGGIWEVQAATYASMYRFDKAQKAALYLTAADAKLERARAVLDYTAGSLRRNDAAIASHFKYVEELPDNIRAAVANNLAATNTELVQRGYEPLILGKATRRNNEVLLAIEEPTRSGIPDAYLYRFRMLAAVEASEGRWLAEKLHERGEMGHMGALIYDGVWRSSQGSAFRDDLIEKAGLAKTATDSTRVYFYAVHSWRLHSGPWLATRLTYDAKELEDVARRIDNLRPYYKP